MKKPPKGGFFIPSVAKLRVHPPRSPVASSAICSYALRPTPGAIRPLSLHPYKLTAIPPRHPPRHPAWTPAARHRDHRSGCRATSARNRFLPPRPREQAAAPSPVLDDVQSVCSRSSPCLNRLPARGPHQGHTILAPASGTQPQRRHQPGQAMLGNVTPTLGVFPGFGNAAKAPS